MCLNHLNNKSHVSNSLLCKLKEVIPKYNNNVNMARPQSGSFLKFKKKKKKKKKKNKKKKKKKQKKKKKNKKKKKKKKKKDQI